MSACLEKCKIPKIWRKATAIALPKPNKPKDDPKSYRPISPLCISFKLLESMINGRINPIIDPQLPHEQAGFRKGWSTKDQVTLLTQDIEDCFEAKETAGAVLDDLTAVYDTVWHCGLTLRLLRMLSDRHMVHFIVERISNRSFVLKTSDGQQSRQCRLKSGVPQGSILAPLLLNIYIHDLPDTISKNYGYADNLAILTVHREWKKIESTLRQDMSTLALYLRQWRWNWMRVRQSQQSSIWKTRKLDMYIDTRRLKFQPTTTYFGVKLDKTLSYRQHLAKPRDKVMTRSALIRKLVGTGWRAGPSTLRTSIFYAPSTCVCTSWILQPNMEQKQAHQPTWCEP